MSLPPLAPVAELERRLGLAPGTLAGSDLVRAGVALEDASTLVRAEAGTDWLAEDGVTVTAPAVVLTVVLGAALRAYRNPDGYSGESVGEYSYQYAREATSGYLTSAEVAIVRRAAGKLAGSGVYTVRTPSAYVNPDAPEPFPLAVVE
ncbi:Phage protein Gp19/Gp15/Gp42 [Micromonospora nigra]|uniref:Phage protein Gp19/Gp15/Gp42 n=1 Tax=Micromonospora nigra TaxID=145857 RepID=A0A1C6SUU4_9ACTN|nr:hypothetical protein [Micromonospora nigra]SCL33023.1 Phage protein Gp19/Gp15/Gp42 [Micromonospora nigra]